MTHIDPWQANVPPEIVGQPEVSHVAVSQP
jgi:hypothetical protein